MKNLVRALMLILFMVVIFIPQETVGTFWYWALFAMMFPLVYLYWRVMYYVSPKMAERQAGKSIPFSVSGARVPDDPKADLQRGRLCVIDHSLYLFVRDERNDSKCKEAWDLQSEKIQTIQFAKLLPMRYGFVVTASDGAQYKITCNAIKKKKKEFFEALGWPYTGS